MSDENVEKLKHLYQQAQMIQESAVNFDATTSANCAGIPDFFQSKACFVHTDRDSWILDSGASENLSYHKDYLSDFKPLLKPKVVNLPNSQEVTVTHYGSVLIFPGFLLHHVLYVPSFKFNLLSVHKICKQLNQFLLFTPSSCFLLQGPFMRTLQEIGKEKGGPYFLQSQHTLTNSNSPFSSSTSIFNKEDVFHSSSGSSFLASKKDVVPICDSSFSLSVSNVTDELWHYRLGHIPSSNMKKISSIPMSSLSNFIFSLHYLSNG